MTTTVPLHYSRAEISQLDGDSNCFVSVISPGAACVGLGSGTPGKELAETPARCICYVVHRRSTRQTESRDLRNTMSTACAQAPKLQSVFHFSG